MSNPLYPVGDVMQAIVTRYLCDGNGSAKMTARSEGRHTKIPYDWALDITGNHEAAMRAHVTKMDRLSAGSWTSTYQYPEGSDVAVKVSIRWKAGVMPDNSMVWVGVADEPRKLYKVTTHDGGKAAAHFDGCCVVCQSPTFILSDDKDGSATLCVLNPENCSSGLNNQMGDLPFCYRCSQDSARYKQGVRVAVSCTNLISE